MDKNSSLDEAPVPKTVLEKEITDWLVKLIEKDELVAALQGQDDIEQIVATNIQRNVIPSFTIDNVSRLECAKAAQFVLTQLTLLEIIAVDKSISLKSGEILRPDIIAYNPESRVIVIFEIKRDTSTERQAVTELMAYEQEIQNNFPFLGNFDLCFVIVARDWSTLMDHAVGSMVTWSGKQCLAIEIDCESAPPVLSCHLPSAWQLLGSIGVPPDALQTVDLTLYESGDTSDDDYPPQIVLTAAQMIVKNGDRANAHGFLMLWKDYAGFKGVRWVFTICALDPAVFFYHSRNTIFSHRTSPLSDFFESRAADISSGDVPEGAMRIMDEARKLLENRYDPQLENFMAWHEKIELHKARAMPFLFEFWGKPGVHIRSLVSHPLVRKNLMPYIARHELDWRSSEVAVPVIEDISGRRPFRDGVVRCSDAFQVGLTLGLLHFLYTNADISEKHENETWIPFTFWAEMSALHQCIEMAQIYHTSETLKVPPPHLTSNREKRIDAINELIDWIQDHLIGQDNPHSLRCFQIGRYGPIFFTDRLEPLTQHPDAEKLRTEVVTDIKTLLKEVLERHSVSVKDNGASKEQIQNVSKIYSDLFKDISKKSDAEKLEAVNIHDLIDGVKGIILPAADSIIQVVYHQAIPHGPIGIDWPYLKLGVKAMFEAGDLRPAVIRDMSGNLGTGALPKFEASFLQPLTQPDIEVYFLDLKAGFSMALKVTWEKLAKDPKFFGPR